jgi:hypothetical protein
VSTCAGDEHGQWWDRAGGGGLATVQVAGGPVATARTVVRVLPTLMVAHGWWSPSTGDTGRVLLQPSTVAHERCSPPCGDDGSQAVAMACGWVAVVEAAAGNDGGGRPGRRRAVK